MERLTPGDSVETREPQDAAPGQTVNGDGYHQVVGHQTMVNGLQKWTWIIEINYNKIIKNQMSVTS